MRNVKSVVLGVAVLGLMSVAPANASLVTSIGALGPNDWINWGQLGPDGSVNHTAHATVVSANGLFAKVSSAGAELNRLNQSSSWDGNFAPGDNLLEVQTGPDITITFFQPVFGAGAQIQANAYGAFTAEITLSNGDVFTQNGVGTNSADGSAIFIGALDPVADIVSIKFDLTSAQFEQNSFAIDTLYVKDAHVPEPITLGLFGAGLAGIGALRRRKAKA